MHMQPQVEVGMVRLFSSAWTTCRRKCPPWSCPSSTPFKNGSWKFSQCPKQLGYLMAVVTATSTPSYIYGRMLFCIFIIHILPNIRFACITAAYSALWHLQLALILTFWDILLYINLIWEVIPVIFIGALSLGENGLTEYIFSGMRTKFTFSYFKWYLVMLKKKPEELDYIHLSIKKNHHFIFSLQISYFSNHLFLCDL